MTNYKLKRKLVIIHLIPLCILAGIGLTQLIYKIFGENTSFSWQIFSGIIVGVMMLYVESKAILKIIN